MKLMVLVKYNVVIKQFCPCKFVCFSFFDRGFDLSIDFPV